METYHFRMGQSSNYMFHHPKKKIEQQNPPKNMLNENLIHEQ